MSVNSFPLQYHSLLRKIHFLALIGIPSFDKSSDFAVKSKFQSLNLSAYSTVFLPIAVKNAEGVWIVAICIN